MQYPTFGPWTVIPLWKAQQRILPVRSHHHYHTAMSSWLDPCGKHNKVKFNSSSHWGPALGLKSCHQLIDLVESTTNPWDEDIQSPYNGGGPRQLPELRFNWSNIDLRGNWFYLGLTLSGRINICLEYIFTVPSSLHKINASNAKIKTEWSWTLSLMPLRHPTCFQSNWIVLAVRPPLLQSSM
jgi:hypothetical protein